MYTVIGPGDFYWEARLGAQILGILAGLVACVVFIKAERDTRFGPTLQGVAYGMLAEIGLGMAILWSYRLYRFMTGW